MRDAEASGSSEKKGAIDLPGSSSESILDPYRFPFQLEWVINQSFEIDHFQPILFIIESFDHLYKEVERLEEWLLTGKLDNLSPGEPNFSHEDSQAFLNQGQP
jgi:phenylalanine-4-hydroxylase